MYYNMYEILENYDEIYVLLLRQHDFHNIHHNEMEKNPSHPLKT